MIEKSLARPAQESTTLNYTKTMREAMAALQRADHDVRLSRRRPEPLATELRICAYQEIGRVKVLLEEAQRAIRTEQAAEEA